MLDFVLQWLSLIAFIGFLAYAVWIYFFREIYISSNTANVADIPLSESLDYDTLLEKLKSALNYPLLNDIFINEEGHIEIKAKYGSYILITEDKKLSIMTTKKTSRQLEEKECIKAYIKYLFDPENSENPQTEYDKLIKSERGKVAVKAISIALFIFIFVSSLITEGDWDSFKSDGISNEYLSSYSQTVTIGDAFENFFADPQWSSYKVKGQKYVDFQGSCYYMGEEATIVITFASNENSFSIKNIAVNGQDLPYILYVGLLDAIYYD